MVLACHAYQWGVPAGAKGEGIVRKGRVVVFGLDGLDLGAVQRWAAEGALPFLGRLLAGGHLVETRDDALPGSQWVNLATGVSPARHGWVHTNQLKAGTYETIDCGADRIGAVPLYEELSRAGLRCAIVDWPGDRPRRGFNGVQVVDWGTEFKLSRFATHPRGFRRRLLREYGEHPLTRHTRTDTSPEGLRRLAAKLERGIEMKARLARDLLADAHWDFMFVGFGEAHKAGHFFWEFHDPAHPDHDRGDGVLRQALRRNYACLDRALAGIAARLGPDDDLILASDRGMQPDLRGDHLLQAVLEGLGLHRRRGVGPATPAPTPAPGGRASGRLGHRLGRAMPAELRAVCKRLLGKADVDWSRTRAFRLPNVGNSYIRINLRGREPQGIVAPGAQYDAVLGYLERELYALINPATGRAAVERVCFPAKLHAGPYRDALPDVAVVWRSEAPIRALRSASLGTVRGEEPASRSGNHTPCGFMLLRGAAFATGPSRTEGDLRQLAPTLLQRFGLPVPAHYERPPLTDLFRQDAAPDLARAS